jgi:esterase
VSFVPEHAVVAGADARGDRVAFLLHGILGSGRNWRTFARRLAASAPTWSFVLVDLRNHGASEGARAPHSVAATADDLAALAARVGRPAVVIGHSFGGKVAASYAARHPEGLARVWVLDSRLDALTERDALGSDVATVIRHLERIPLPIARREDLVAALQSAGFSAELAGWMTTNLRRTDGGLVWAFDLDAVREMIEDYWRVDLEPALSDPALPLSLVRAGRSDRWPSEVIERYARRAHPGVEFHLLPDAGHWLHIDDPDGLHRLIAPSFPAIGGV